MFRFVDRWCAAALVLTLLMAITACTPDSHPGPVTPPPSPSTRPVDFGPPAATAAARLGDQTGQALADVAATGSRVVAVGNESADGLVRPFFLLSSDGGRRWQRVGMDPQSQQAAGTRAGAWHLAAGRRGFLAAGEVGGRPQLWRSDTGASWRAVSLGEEVVGDADSIDVVIAHGSGWLAAGTHQVAAGSALGSVVTWTSPDGVHWARQDLLRAGVRPVPGTPSVVDVAANGRTIVIVGGIEDNKITKQPNRIAFWRSQDAGARWSQVSTPDDLAGDYRAYADDLVVHDGTFYLLATGEGRDKGSWDGVVLDGGADGGAWRKSFQPKAWSSKADESPNGMVWAGDRWIIFGSVGQQPSDAVITTGPNLEDQRKLGGSSLTGPRDQSVVAGTAVGGVPILVGHDLASGSESPVMWSPTRATSNPVGLPASATGGRPTAFITDAVGARRRVDVVGSVSQTPTAWSSDDGATWSPRQLPSRSKRIDGGQANAVTTFPISDRADRGAIAVGIVYPARGSQAAAWRREPQSTTWRQVTSRSFRSPVKDDYGSYQASTVAAGDTMVVAAGTHNADGRTDAAFWYSRDAGENWNRAEGERSSTLTKAERDDNWTPYPAFRGPANGTIDVAQVAALRVGFVAVGSITTAGRDRPVFWRSTDGVTWTSPRTLPAPAGVWASQATSVVVSGGRIAIGGSAHRVAGDDGLTGVSWASADGDRWQVGRPTPGPMNATVLAVPGGFLTVGSTGRSGNEDAAAWMSRDGLAWRPAALPLLRGTGPGSQKIDSAVLLDGELLLVAADVPPTGGGEYAVRLPVPRP